MTDSTQTPLERAARALCRAQGLPEDYTGIGTCGDPSWRFKIDEARAVLQAIREPDTAWVDKAMESEYIVAWGDYKEFWQAMIDAALVE